MILEYKGYKGSVTYSLIDGVYYGKFYINSPQNISYTYQGHDIESLKIGFMNAVDNYIETINEEYKWQA